MHRKPTQEESQLVDEAWATDELMRKAWSESRGSRRSRSQLWQFLLGQIKGKGAEKSRQNWLRAPVSFTLHKGESETDLLQEYFVPIDKCGEMIEGLKRLFERNQHCVTVLSTTIRIVQKDDLTLMTYCPEARACIAVDVSVPLERVGGIRQPTAEVFAWVSEATEMALDFGGSFYLPYYRFAAAEQVSRAYPAAADLVAQSRVWNPDHAFSSDFAAAYLQG
jgi:hypothetical protein